MVLLKICYKLVCFFFHSCKIKIDMCKYRIIMMPSIFKTYLYLSTVSIALNGMILSSQDVIFDPKSKRFLQVV